MRPVALLLLALAACRFDPSGLPAGSADGLPDAARDAADGMALDRTIPDIPAETAADLTPPEAGPDASPDGSATDSALDSALPDAVPDEAVPDLPAPDASVPDLPAPDTGIDPLAPFGAAQPLVVLNSLLSEDDPTLTGDMLEICFDRGGDIWHSVRSSTTAAWGLPVPVAALNSLSGETTPSITPDGLTIFFGSNRPGGPGDVDIYVSTRSSRVAGWSTPQLVSSLSTSSMENAPAPGPDLLELVLSSNRPGSADHDLYLAGRASPAAAWAAPVNLGAVNSGAAEGDPWLGTTVLYFSSTRPGKGGFDIWLSQRSGGSFGAPVAVDSLNTSSSDGDPWLSPDLRTVVFSSDRSGTWDLYVATR